MEQTATASEITQGLSGLKGGAGLGSWEATSETGTGMPEVQEGERPGPTPPEAGGSRTGQKDKPGCDATAKETWLTLRGDLKMGWPPRTVVSWGKGAPYWLSFHVEQPGEGPRPGPTRQPSRLQQPRRQRELSADGALGTRGASPFSAEGIWEAHWAPATGSKSETGCLSPAIKEGFPGPCVLTTRSRPQRL